MSWSESWRDALRFHLDYSVKISHDNLLRWWVSVFALLAAFILWVGDLIPSIGPVVALFLGYNILQGAGWLLVKTGRASRRADTLLHGADALFITASLHWTGGVESPLSFLYALPVIVELYHKHLAGVLFNGAAGIVCYAALLFGLEGPATPRDGMEFFARLVLLATLWIISVVSVVLLRRKERSLERHVARQETAFRIHQVVDGMGRPTALEELSRALERELSRPEARPPWRARVWMKREGSEAFLPVGDAAPGSALEPGACPALSQQARFRAENASDQRACGVEGLNVGSHACFPLMAGREPVGLLVVASPDEDAFSSDDIQFIDSIARMASLGAERVLKMEELRFSCELGQKALATFSSSTRGVEETINAILDAVVEFLDVDRVNIMLWEPELKVLQARWFRGAPPPLTGRVLLRMGEGIAGMALRFNQPYWTADAKKDPHFLSAKQGTIQSLLAIPMQTVDGKPLGVINALTLERVREFSKRDVEFVTVFSRQAAFAIENALLHEDKHRTIDKLREIDRLKSEFLSRVSHELRGPLSAIEGLTEMLDAESDGLLGSRQRELLLQIRNSAQVQMRMVEDLLDLAAIERGSWSLRLTACPVAEIVRDEFEKARLFAAAEGVEMRVELPSDPSPVIQADAERLRQVVWNLLHNALKYTHRGDSISVALFAEEESVSLQVRDTGAGIPPEALGKIFEKFQQGHGERSRRLGGLGLGLALAQEIIEAHGGRISAQSPGMGRGSTFTFTLPRKAPQQDVQPHSA